MTASESQPPGAKPVGDEETRSTFLPISILPFESLDGLETTMGEIRLGQLTVDEVVAGDGLINHTPLSGPASTPTRLDTARLWVPPFNLDDTFDSDSSSDEDEDDYSIEAPATLNADERQEHSRRRAVAEILRLRRRVFDSFSRNHVENPSMRMAPRSAAHQERMGIALPSSQRPPSPPASSSSLPAMSSPNMDEDPFGISALSLHLTTTTDTDFLAVFSQMSEQYSSMRPMAGTMSLAVAQPGIADGPPDESENGRYAYFDEIEARVEAGLARLRNGSA